MDRASGSLKGGLPILAEATSLAGEPFKNTDWTLEDERKAVKLVRRINHVHCGYIYHIRNGLPVPERNITAKLVRLIDDFRCRYIHHSRTGVSVLEILSRHSAGAHISQGQQAVS